MVASIFAANQRLRGAPAFEPDFYVDSVSGSDSNNGLTELTAFQTWTRADNELATGVKYKAAPDSVFRQMLNTINTQSAVFVGHPGGGASGALPIMSVFNVVNPASWSPAVQPNVYVTTISHTITEGGTAEAMAKEDGVLLAKVASEALCSATPGSIYCPNDDAISTNNPYTLYYHPTGSTDPRSNGRTVEANARDHGIEDISGVSNTFEGFELDGCGVDDGCMDGGRDFTLRRALLTNGGKHHIVFRSGTVEDVITADFLATWEQAITEVTAYNDTAPDALNVLVRRWFGKNGQAGFLSHFGTGNYYNDVQIEQFAVSAISAAGLTTLVRYGHFTGTPTTTLSISLQLPSTALTVTHCTSLNFDQGFVRGGTIGGTPPALAGVSVSQCAAYANSAASGSRFGIFTGANTDLTVSNVTLNLARSSYAVRGLKNLTLNNSVIVLDAANATQFVEAGTSFSGNNNVYVLIGTNNYFFRLNGTNYANNFAGWQAATGADANSVIFTGATLSDVFEGDTSTNDWRLKTTGTIGAAIASRSAGMREHWNFNTRSIVSSAPTRVPVCPSSIAEGRDYVRNPPAWNFYP